MHQTIMDEAMLYVKLYGAQTTCTKLTRLLLEGNFQDLRTLTNVLGCAHGSHKKIEKWDDQSWSSKSGLKELAWLGDSEKVEIQKAYKENKVRYVVCVKDPYYWYVSMLRRRGIQYKYMDYDDLKSEINLWNGLYRHWYKEVLTKENSWVAKFEDIVHEPRVWLNEFSEWIEVKRNKNLYWPRKKQSEEKDDRSAYKITKYEREFYSERKYLKTYSPKALSIFKKNLDRELMELFGYKIAEIGQ